MSTALAEYVDPYPGRKGTGRVEQDCGRCGGTGQVLSSVDGHRCAGCAATGTVTVLVASARITARRPARAAAQRVEPAASISHDYETAKAALAAQIPDFGLAHNGQLGIPAAAAAADAVVAYRDHGDLYQVIDDYDFRTRRRFLPRLLGPNRYPAGCVACQQHVPAGAGTRGETTEGYLTWCPVHVPTQTRDR